MRGLRNLATRPAGAQTCNIRATSVPPVPDPCLAESGLPLTLCNTLPMRSSPFLPFVLTAALFASGTSAQTIRPAAASRFQIPATDDGLPGTGPIRRHDWFKGLWAERRAAWAARTQLDQHAFVFLGDSITQGWGDDLGGSFPGMKLANRGISGDTTRGMLLRLEEDVLALHPTGVALLLGTNDLEDQADPETIAGNLKLILAALKRHDPKMPVVLCEVFPSSASQKRPATSIKKINQLYAAAIKDDPQVTLVETWPLFADAQGDAVAAEFPDLLHPNKAGYAKWAAALRPTLAMLGFLELEDDRFAPEPGFTSLFNGRDLTGWSFQVTPPSDIASAANWKKNDPSAPPWPVINRAVTFDGLTRSIDGRYVAKHGRILVTPPAEGRRIQQMWTTREFAKDFVLKLEFRASPNADSGVFIRQPQLQCRDYPIAGPYKNLKSFRPMEWNEMVVTVTGGVARCTCNGEVLEAAFKVPATGRIGLEGDRGLMEYRRIRVRELP